MFDSTKPSKQIMNLISGLIAKQISKQEIFRQVAEENPALNHDSIAIALSSIIKSEEKRKYKFHAYVLSLLFLVNIIFVLLLMPQRHGDSSLIFYWIGRIFVLFLSFLFINGFLHFKLWWYTTAISYYSLWVILIIYYWFTFPLSNILIISSISTIVLFLYLYFLRMKLFPNINFWGKVIKVNGKYLF